MKIIKLIFVNAGILSSLVFMVFIFRVFDGAPFIGLSHYDPGPNAMAWLALIAAGYMFFQQQSLASRHAATLTPNLVDIGTSMATLVMVILFGWLRLGLGYYTLSEYQRWALPVFTLICIADGVYNSYLTIKFMPRYFEVQKN